MTDAQASETATSSPFASLWLALLLAMLIALVPGPQVTAPASLTKQLSTPTAALAALHGQDLVARKDAADTRLMVPAAPPPGLTLPAFLQAGVSVTYAAHGWLAAVACALLFWARAPPRSFA